MPVAAKAAWPRQNEALRPSGHRLRDRLGVRSVGLVDLPRFRGVLSIWNQARRIDGILVSCVETFFGSAPGGANLLSRPA
jgi:hypothetical protein